MYRCVVEICECPASAASNHIHTPRKKKEMFTGRQYELSAEQYAAQMEARDA
jgi:hypothetical protein